MDKAPKMIKACFWWLQYSQKSKKKKNACCDYSEVKENVPPEEKKIFLWVVGASCDLDSCNIQHFCWKKHLVLHIFLLQL